MSIKEQILQASYWEHHKWAKELSYILPVDHPKRVLLEEHMNELIKHINNDKLSI